MADKLSRIEPTCWALLALAHHAGQAPDLDVLRRWPRQNRWLVDVPGAPPNHAFNALAALTLLHTAINTHPHVVIGAAIACRRAGAAEVVVGEGPGHRRDIEYLLSSTGLHDQLREERIRFVDLNHDDVRLVPLRSSFTGLSELALPVELLRSDFVISMPKLKTHHWAGLTCSMKNLFGAVPGAVYGWPKNLLHAHGIPNSILDLVATIRPRLAIVDAVTAMEGDGPIMGRPRPVGFIGMGTDLVAVDATCARVIGLNPNKLSYLEPASRFLGVVDEQRIRHRGEHPSRYATTFDLVPDLEHLRDAI